MVRRLSNKAKLEIAALALFMAAAIAFSPSISGTGFAANAPSICDSYFGDSICDDTSTDCGSAYQLGVSEESCNECQTGGYECITAVGSDPAKSIKVECGDGTCGEGETPLSCQQDCGDYEDEDDIEDYLAVEPDEKTQQTNNKKSAVTTKPAVCKGFFGDSICDDSAADCGSAYQQGTSIDDCDECQTGGYECVTQTGGSQPTLNLPVCGDGLCVGKENAASCPADCSLVISSVAGDKDGSDGYKDTNDGDSKTQIIANSDKSLSGFSCEAANTDSNGAAISGGEISCLVFSKAGPKPVNNVNCDVPTSPGSYEKMIVCSSGSTEYVKFVSWSVIPICNNDGICSGDETKSNCAADCTLFITHVDDDSDGSDGWLDKTAGSTEIGFHADDTSLEGFACDMGGTACTVTNLANTVAGKTGSSGECTVAGGEGTYTKTISCSDGSTDYYKSVTWTVDEPEAPACDQDGICDADETKAGCAIDCTLSVMSVDGDTPDGGLVDTTPGGTSTVTVSSGSSSLAGLGCSMTAPSGSVVCTIDQIKQKTADCTVNVQNHQSYSEMVTCSDAGKAVYKKVAEWEVNVPPQDTTPPVISNGLPTGQQPAGIKFVNLFVKTNENAECRYSKLPNQQFGSMTKFFKTGTLLHTQKIDVQHSTSYDYNVKCRDEKGNTNTDDYAISFSVAAPGGSAEIVASSITNNQISVIITAEGKGTETNRVDSVSWNMPNTCEEETKSVPSTPAETFTSKLYATCTGSGVHTMTAIFTFELGNTAETIATVNIPTASIVTGGVKAAPGGGANVGTPPSSSPPPSNKVSTKSCQNACGAQAPSGCWCDTACTGYGDCCSDYQTYCG